MFLWKKHNVFSLLTLSSILLYFFFAYDLVRTDYVKLVSLYTALFVIFYALIQTSRQNLKLLTWIAFICRAVFILAIPNLSQDFYRFIWDGRLILEGLNPYLYIPESFIAQGTFPIVNAQELYDGMGMLSASHFTNYPPLNQLCFVIANLIPGKSILSTVIGLRLIIIAADFGTLYFGKKLLEKLKMPKHTIFWYILNPFIIIELTGNLHFEGVMIFFLIWSVYLLHSGKWKLAAVVLACSVSIKLIPLIFLPLFYQWFTKKPFYSSRENITKPLSGQAKSRPLGFLKLITFYSTIGITTLLLFLPFYSSEFINNYSETVALWFQNFEFNASLYYVAREIGYLFRGWNEIAIIGKILPIIVVLFVVTIALLRKNNTTKTLISAMLLVLTFYFFTSTTVHPWYVATLLILSVFTRYRFPLVWSFVIILSYLSYIQNGKAGTSENLWIIGLEYLVVYGVFVWEVCIKKPIKA